MELNAITCKEFGDKLHFVVEKQWDVLPNATQAYNGFLYSNILGKPYFIVYNEQHVAAHYVNVDELAGYNIINAYYDKNVLIMVAEKDNHYDRFVIKFDTDFKKYTIDKTENVDTADVNFTVLDNGIVVFIPNDEEMLIFSNKMNSKQVKRISDSSIKSTMRLCNNGVDVMFYIDNKLFKVKMN